MRNLRKIIESIDGRLSKVTLPTRYRESFSRYLVKRKLILDPPYKTDVWNNAESAYTLFEIPVTYEVADLIFDDWIDECESLVAK